jgi:hypothetical protein
MFVCAVVGFPLQAGVFEGADSRDVLGIARRWPGSWIRTSSMSEQGLPP